MAKQIVKVSEIMDGKVPNLPQARGFPRPVVMVDQFTGFYSNRYSDAEFLNKTYPVPYTAHDASLADIDNKRYRECMEDILCIVCGDACPDDDRFGIWSEALGHDKMPVATRPPRWGDEPGPFHEKCAKLTLARCPHFVASNNGVPDGAGRYVTYSAKPNLPLEIIQMKNNTL